MLFSIPDDLPPDGIESQTGVACPDCSGTLVMIVRKNFAGFRCRVGHAYSLLEVVTEDPSLNDREVLLARMRALAAPPGGLPS